MIYSITETAMLNGLKPYTYLTFVLDRMNKLPDFPTEDQNVAAMVTESSGRLQNSTKKMISIPAHNKQCGQDFLYRYGLLRAYN